MQPPVQIDPGRLRFRTRCPAVAVLIDGTVRAVLATSAGWLDWAWPHDLFGRLLDIVSASGGRSLLAAPVDLEAHRRVQWLGWARDGLEVAGRFAVDGPAAPDARLPLPISLVAGGLPYAAGFAAPGRRARDYRFRLRLARLPPGEDGLSLQPCIAGLPIERRLAIPSAAFPVRGHVDRGPLWGARGWAAPRDGTDARVEVTLHLDGRAVATAIADLPRADVAAAGVGDGRHGFHLPFPPGTRLDRALLIDVRAGDARLGLAGSPYLQPAAPAHLGRFDGMDGAVAGGWVIATAALDRPVRVEAVCDGVVVGAGLADRRRSDVGASGLPRERCGFQFALEAPTARLLGRDIAVRAEGDDAMLPGSPSPIPDNGLVAAFLARTVPARMTPATLARLRPALARRDGLVVSVLLPLADADPAHLAEAIASVRAQWSDGWELICVGAATAAGRIAAEAARADPRIRLLRDGGLDQGLAAARGALVCVLDPDDALEPDAVHRLAETARSTGAGVIYADEIATGPALDQLLALRARPAFSHDYLLSYPALAGFVAVPTALARAAGGWGARLGDGGLGDAAAFDALLRVLERAGSVAHVPRPLYRRRETGRPPATGAAVAGAIARHLHRLGHPDARVQRGAGPDRFRVDWPDDGGETLVVIPTKDRADLLERCLDSLERTTAGERMRVVVVDHASRDPAARRLLRRIGARHAVMPYAGPFDFARMNNQAIAAHGAAARYLLFLNNDVEALSPGWLPRLRSLAGRAEVGAVGPMLLYGDGRVQHGGVLVGFDICAAHAMRFADPTDPEGRPAAGYNGSLSSTRDFSAVTAACMLVRRAVFDDAGGFDPAFPIGYNDTDLCLRLRRAGYKILYDGHTRLMHRESATRAADPALGAPKADDDRLRARWPDEFERGDPFYSPLLTPAGRDHRLRSDIPPRSRLAPRVQPAPRRAQP